MRMLAPHVEEGGVRRIRLAGREPHGDAGREPDRTRHRGERARELLAVPTLGLEQEVLEHVTAVARWHGEVVGEGAEVVLQSERCLVRGVALGRQLLGQLPHGRAEVGREAEELRPDLLGDLASRSCEVGRGEAG